MSQLVDRAQERVERADSRLTPAQMTVLELVGHGLTTSRIAARLQMSPATVEAHIRGSMERLGARTRLQAAALVPPGIDAGAGADAETLRLLDGEEHRLLQLLAEGATLCEAALSMHLSRRTCARRLASAKAKLGARTTVEAVLETARHHVPRVLVVMLACSEALADALGLVDGPFAAVFGVVPF